MTVKVREKGRGIAVPLEGASLSTILRHLREQVLAGDPPVEVAKSRSREDVRACRDDADAGRLRWSFLDSSYQIFYADEKGGNIARTKVSRSRGRMPRDARCLVRHFRGRDV